MQSAAPESVGMRVVRGIFWFITLAALFFWVVWAAYNSSEGLVRAGDTARYTRVDEGTRAAHTRFGFTSDINEFAGNFTRNDTAAPGETSTCSRLTGLGKDMYENTRDTVAAPLLKKGALCDLLYFSSLVNYPSPGVPGGCGRCPDYVQPAAWHNRMTYCDIVEDIFAGGRDVAGLEKCALTGIDVGGNQLATLARCACA